MSEAIVVRPGEGPRTGNVEFLALSEHTPRFNLSIITMAAGRKGPPAHVHDEEDDAFYVLDGELVFVLGEDEVSAPEGTFVLVGVHVRRRALAGRRDRDDREVEARRVLAQREELDVADAQPLAGGHHDRVAAPLGG